MEQKTLLVKTTSKGQTVTIIGQDYLDTALMYARMDGKMVGNSSREITKRNDLPAGFSHVVCTNICLRPEEAEELSASFAEYKVAVDLEHAEENAFKALRRQRESLEDTYRAHRQVARDRRDRSYESGDGTGAWVSAGEADDKAAEDAMAAIKAFDEEHPEVIAKIKAEKDAAAKRNIWN